MSENATEVKYETCRITLVNNAASDEVIDVYPAKHKAEKIWLNGRRGIERWDAVKRILNMYAPRGSHVPAPAPWHSDIKQPTLLTLAEKDIPRVSLDGYVLEPLPAEDVFVPAVKPDTKQDALEKRVSSIENNLSLIVNLLTAKQAVEAPEPESAAEATTFLVCPKCNKQLKNAQAVAIHNGRFHKQ